jgi:hypothetical protein
MSALPAEVRAPYLMCPSAQPEMSNAVILGVRGVSSDDSLISYLENPAPVSSKLLALTEPLPPTEVYRIAATCEEKACRHFDGSSCTLATRIVQILPAVVDVLPPCKIRNRCRWFQQEGRAACLRCPQVVTHSENASEQFRLAATPR